MSDLPQSADSGRVIVQRRSLPDRLRYLADELEVAGESQREAIALLLRQTADEVAPNEQIRGTP